MFVFRNVIEGLAMVLNSLLGLYFWIVFIAVILDWVNPDPRNPIVQFLRSVTEPVLYAIRRRMPFLIVGRLDLSPIVLLLGIRFTQYVVVRSLFELAVRISARTDWLRVG